ncbi:MAG: galactokinase, partial [Oscillospiraceae bacterium]|nr:galactokinase [Oscillospiraceae bacterium]
MKNEFFSAPGRIEICGNHTDHQRGSVLAAAIDLDTSCVAAANGTNTIRIMSEGFGAADVDLLDLNPREREKGSMISLVRGVAAWFKEAGYSVGGFTADVKSSIPAGVGLSSSAAFEVLIGNVFKGLFSLSASPLDIALAGQFAENRYFGKPSGLMDQAASSFGGMMTIDFFDPIKPVITKLNADFNGYDICVVRTGDSHAGSTHEYADIPAEMEAIAGYFGESSLRTVPQAAFYSAINDLRNLSDRAILRAIHFFDEMNRVEKQAAALQRGDIKEFLSLIIESGRSSAMYLQNIYSPETPARQGLSLALALSEKIL